VAQGIEGDGFLRASARVVLGVEVDHHLLAGHVRETHFGAARSGQAEIGCLVAFLNHRLAFLSSDSARYASSDAAKPPPTRPSIACAEQAGRSTRLVKGGAGSDHANASTRTVAATPVVGSAFPCRTNRGRRLRRPGDRTGVTTLFARRWNEAGDGTGQAQRVLPSRRRTARRVLLSLIALV